MSNHTDTPILLASGQTTKQGKHVVTFSAAMGVSFQGAAALALALGGALSLALPQAAAASQCGPMPAGSGDVVCNVETYTPSIAGDGTEAVPGTTPISYSGTWMQDTTITIDQLFLTTGPLAVFLQTLAGSQTPDGDGIMSSIVINGSTISTTDPTNNRGVWLLDRATTSAGAVVELNDGVRITTAGRNAHGAQIVSVDVTDPTGGASVTLNGDAQIMTSGEGARGAYAQQQERTVNGGARAAVDYTVTLNDSARIVTEGRNADGAWASLNVGDNSVSNARVTLNGNTRIITSGLNARGAFASQHGTSATGNVVVTLNNNAAITTSGTLAHGAYARIWGEGEGLVELNDAVAITTSGAGAHAVFAEVAGRVNVPLYVKEGGGVTVLAAEAAQEGGEPVRVQRAVLDADGIQVGLADVSIPRVHPGSNSATITMNGGTVSNSGRDSAGLFAFNENLSGNATIAMTGGTVTSTGAGVVGLRAEISAPSTVEIDPETGLAIFEPIRNNDGEIELDEDGLQIYLAIRDAFKVPAPERRVDDVTDEILRSTGTAGVTVGAEAAVSVSGAGATGIKVDHAGVGNVDVNVAGSVIASGEGARGISIAGEFVEAVNLNITGIVRGGQGENAFAVFIDTPAANSTVTIGAGAQLGTPNPSSGSINVGTASVTNNGTIFGGVQAGSLVNTTSGSIVMRSGDTFRITGNMTNDGALVIGSNTAEIGGNLSGNGTISAEANFATGASGVLIVGGDVTGNVVLDINPIGGRATAAGVAALQILRVDGSTTGNVSLKNGPIDLGAITVDVTVKNGEIVPVAAIDASSNPVAAAITSQGAVITQAFVGTTPAAARQGARFFGAGASTVSVPASVRMLPVVFTQGTSAGELAAPSGPARKVTVGPWASLEADRFSWRPDSGQTARGTTQRFEGGYDLLVDTSMAGTLIVGGGLQLGTVDARFSTSGGTSRSEANAAGLSLTASYFAPSGSYVDVALNTIHARSKLLAPGGETLASGINSTALVAKMEIGHRFAVDMQSALTPSAQLTLGEVRTQGYTTSLEDVVSRQRDDISELRLGLDYERVLENGSSFTMFGAYSRDLSPASKVTVNGVNQTTRAARDWAETGLRLGTALGERVTLRGELGYRTAFGTRASGNTNAFARVGVNFQW